MDSLFIFLFYPQNLEGCYLYQLELKRNNPKGSVA